jgi:hypothetical protein
MFISISLSVDKINRDEPNKGKVVKCGNPTDAMSGRKKRDKPNEVKVGM